MKKKEDRTPKLEVQSSNVFQDPSSLVLKRDNRHV